MRCSRIFEGGIHPSDRVLSHCPDFEFIGRIGFIRSLIGFSFFGLGSVAVPVKWARWLRWVLCIFHWVLIIRIGFCRLARELSSLALGFIASSIGFSYLAPSRGIGSIGFIWFHCFFDWYPFLRIAFRRHARGLGSFFSYLY